MRPRPLGHRRPAGRRRPPRHRLAELVARHGVDRRELLARVTADARASVEAVAASRVLDLPADHRLAFRELGLAIGLRAAAVVAARPPGALGRSLHAPLANLRRHLPLAERTEAFWSDPAPRHGLTWQEHRDIDDVMLASLIAAAG